MKWNPQLLVALGSFLISPLCAGDFVPGSEVDSPRASANRLLEQIAFHKDPGIPTDDQLRALAEEALLKFDASVKAGDFTKFYEFVSERWKRPPSRRAITVAGLERVFGKFIDAHVDLSAIKGKPMILDKPASLSPEGVLSLKGKFDVFVFRGEKPPVPQRMDFKLEYVLEEGQWKVFGITVNLTSDP